MESINFYNPRINNLVRFLNEGASKLLSINEFIPFWDSLTNEEKKQYLLDAENA